MCGSYIYDHGIGDGHSPVPMYDYALDQAEARVTAAERALAEMQAQRDVLAQIVEADLCGNIGAWTLDGWETYKRGVLTTLPTSAARYRAVIEAAKKRYRIELDCQKHLRSDGTRDSLLNYLANAEEEFDAAVAALGEEV
jgi:hypothetical protein